MYAGLQHASGDYCVFMDADLQHPPSLLREMYRVLKNEGYDCCAGFREDREGEGRVRSFLSRRFYKIVNKICDMNMSDGAGDYRMMNRAMADSILEFKEYNRYMKGIFSFIGFDTKWIPFRNVERAAGNSKWLSLIHIWTESIMLLFVSFCGAAAWILNGTLYARAKILIPFVPLVVLQCAKLLNELRMEKITWKLWPCLIAAACLFFFRSKNTFPWIAADLGILLFVVLVSKIKVKEPLLKYRYVTSRVLLCFMPCMLFYQTMQKEQFVKKEDVFTDNSVLDSSPVYGGSPLYRYDTLTDVLNTGNLAVNGRQQKSAMYSSISVSYTRLLYISLDCSWADF